MSEEDVQLEDIIWNLDGDFGGAYVGYPFNEVKKAMTKWAEIQSRSLSIGFAEWMRKMDVNISINDIHWYIPTKKGELGLGEICTDEELYSKYLQFIKPKT